MRISRRFFGVTLFLVFLAIGPPTYAHGPADHHDNSMAMADGQTMQAQHERMGKFKAAMSSLLEAVIDGNSSGARDQSARLMETLSGYEKDVPHKNAARIKEFKGFYAELKKRIDTLSGETRSGGTPKTAVAFGRVLESCAACHSRFRD